MPTGILPSASLTERPIAWITGSEGLIGSALVRNAERFFPGFEIRGLHRGIVDLLDSAAITRLYRQERPALIVHCAALTRNPLCDANPDLAWRTNVDATRHLLELAATVPFCFFSTDLVFDGIKGNYVEEDSPNPLSIYAETKVRGEELVRNHAQHTIIRISLTGGRTRGGDRSFNEELMMAWRAGRSLNLFTDEYRCPTGAKIVARATWELLAQKTHGTFHVCGANRLSRYEIGLALAAKYPGLSPTIIASSRLDYKGPSRPPDTSLNCGKAGRLLSFPLPGFSEVLTSSEF